jgi:hypothetical protein
LRRCGHSVVIDLNEVDSLGVSMNKISRAARRARLQYLEDKLGAGYDGIDGILSVPVVGFEREKVSLLGTGEDGHLGVAMVGGCGASRVFHRDMHIAH